MVAVDPAAVVGSVAPVVGAAALPSFVVVGVRDGRAVGAFRVDLVGAESAVERLAELVSGDGAQGAVVVVVDAKARRGAYVRRIRVLSAGLEAALRRNGLELMGSFAVDVVVEGGRWFSLNDAEERGFVGGSRLSEWSESAEDALSAELRRPHVVRWRGEPSVEVDPVRAAVLNGLLSGRVCTDSVSVESAVRVVLGVVQRVKQWDVLTDEQMADAGMELMDRRVRAALLRLADSAELAGSAHFLWGELARVLPLPYRAGALALLAFSAFRRGEATLAGMAAKAALMDQPEDRLTALVDRARAAQWAPDAVRAVLDCAEVEMAA